MRTAQRDREQERRTDCKRNLADEDQSPALEAIRRVPGSQEEQNARKELREADQSKIQWAPRHLVHLPAHGDRLHLQRADDQEPRQLVEDEVGIGKCDSAREPWLIGNCHPHLL